MASPRSTLNFRFSTESPFHTSIAMGKQIDTKIYTAKQIADFILCMEVSEEETRNAEALARGHGLLSDDFPVPNDVTRSSYEEIFLSNCIVAIAHFYNKLSDLKTESIFETYEVCARAINSLTYLLQTPEDKTSRLPGPVKLSRGERWILDRVWDISVCLLGSVKARCSFERKIRIGDIPLIHDVHYRRAAKKALDENGRFGQGRICQKTLKFLTREEIEPFIQPYHLIQELEFKRKPYPNDHFSHIDCSLDECKFDVAQHNEVEDYHVPGCSVRPCGKSMPPKSSLAEFESIAHRDMPAVNVSDSGSWWVPADHDTLAVSHLWRDGIWGTRDQGINKCVHELLVEIAKKENCKSYWIDCATIPEEEDTRERMIMRINRTFMNARIVLCWDRRLATLGPDIKKMLLSLVVSAWHRRAWTLLEGNRGCQSNMMFLRWGDQGRYELFDLRLKINSVFRDPDVPLWIRSALVEFLPYSGAVLPVDAAGLLLSGRHATRPDDSEAIWGLLRPFEATTLTTDFDFSNPYAHAKTVDVAFISSNATRFTPENCTQSWRPNKPNASIWVRTAYGGIDSRVIGATHDEKNIECTWWFKDGRLEKDFVDWNLASREINWLKDQDRFKLALICPILKGDPVRSSIGSYSSPPVMGFFRTELVMECARAIMITQDKGDNIWQWRGLIHMKKGHPLRFHPGEFKEFIIGSTKR